MQGQRSSVGSFPDRLEFHHRSSSSVGGMDQDIYWSRMLLHQTETHNLPNYLLSSSDTNMSFVNMSTEDSSSLNIWNSGGSTPAGDSLDQGNHDEIKMELGWSASSLGGGSVEADNLLSLEGVDINLNSAQLGDEQSFSFSLGSNLNDAPQDPECNTSSLDVEVSESSLFSHPYVPSLLDCEHGPSSSSHHGNSSGIVGFMSGDYDDRPGTSLDGRRLACKRKNIEGLLGQSAASGSANFIQRSENNSEHSVSVGTNVSAGISISSTSSYIPGASSSHEQLNPRFSTMTRGAALNGYLAARLAGNAGSSQRNFRMRINPARQHDVCPPNLSSSRDNSQNPNIWLSNEASSNLIPFNQRLESRPVPACSSPQNQPHRTLIPGLLRHVNLYPWNEASASRNGSSSSSMNLTETLTAIREDIISMNTPRNNVSVQSLLLPTTEIRNGAQDTVSWNIPNRSASVSVAAPPASRAGTSSGAHLSMGPTWTPHYSPPSQFSRGLAEAVHQTLLTSVGSESRGQSSNFLSQRSSHSSTTQESHQSGSVSCGNQQSHMRPAFLLDRQSDGVPMPVMSLAAREGRSRMISEIRNALDLMRRGGNLRFEDVFMLDHPVFHGVADLNDRHRDMRLDVDNMSYEELLALEERIGNVNTGLGEETILKRLKQKKHYLLGVGATAETEPCCICQEEYAEGEDIGTLDCGHDFHTACIKQWLMHKNLCPICKTTALVA